MIRKSLFGLAAWFFAVLFSFSGLASEPIPELLWEAHNLRYIELQMEAIVIDMELPLMSAEEDKPVLKAKADLAVSHLLDLKEKLYQISTHNDLDIPKKALSEQLNRLIVLYTDIVESKEQELEMVWESFLTARQQYFESLSQIVLKYQIRPDLPAGFTLHTACKNLFSRAEDKAAFEEAIFLMRRKEFGQASEKLETLKKSNEEPVVETILALYLSDCYLMHESDLARHPGSAEKGWGYLEEALKAGSYHPLVYEVFYKWRTVNQMLHYGMSNYSTIPNNRYNDERWRVYEILKDHLRGNPLDGWAMIQTGLLWELPNVERGGPVGNRNIEHWGVLYTDAEAQPQRENETVPREVLQQVAQKMGIQ